jgi:glycerophosphoryl diester phosphodiesterase
MLFPMLIFAHRGIKKRGIADENSVGAFQAAVELGIDGIEFDVRMTRDGKAVVMHDPDFRRVAGDTRKVEALSYREIGEVVLRHGSAVPLLDDVTAVLPEPFNIDFEIKDPKAFELVKKKLRTSAGLRSRSIISSYHEDIIEKARRALPDVRRFLLVNRWPIFWTRFADRLREIGVSGLGFPTSMWTDVRVRKAKEEGFETIAWEPTGLRSSRARAVRLEHIGIDIAIANNPKKYVEALR